MEQSDEGWACAVCGWVYEHTTERPPVRSPCPKAPDRMAAAAERLSLELAARFASGRATRSAVEIESLLVICRQCPSFTGDGCRVYDGCDRSTPVYLTVLCDARRHCKKWPAAEE